MSHEIYCPECNYANTPGSKFCNNCGSKLPLSTHILCPICSTANTRDRIFCDNCGSRLIPDEKPHPEEPDVQEPATGSGAFTLPTRKPGETGELDPSKLPDWLSRQMSEQAAEDDEDEGIPHIEEFQSDKRQTDDLPDWLVHDSDPEPIIDAPSTISTEFFMDLVGKADDLPDLDELNLDQDDDLMRGAKEANLPDWLSEADAIPDNTGPISEQEPLPEPEEIFSDIADETLFADLESDLPDEEEDEPGWLTDEVGSSTQDDGGVTEWLSDLEETTVETLDQAADEAEEGTGLTEWLADLDSGELSTDSSDEEDAVDLFAQDTLEETDEDADEWLADLAEDETETAVSPAPSSSYTESFPEPDEDNGDSWWNEFSADDADDEEDEVTPAAPSTEPTVLDSIPESDEDEDGWWDDFAEDEEPTPSITSDEADMFDDIPESDDDDSWWDDLSEADPAAEAPAEDLLAEEPDDDDETETAVPEWKTVTDEQFDTLFEETTAEEIELPDWLSAAGEETGSLLADEVEEPSAESLNNTQHLIENAETDWLADLEGITSETPELSGDFLGLDDEDDSFIDDLAAPLTEDGAESEPDWFSDLSAVDTGQLLLEAEADLEHLPEPEEDTTPERPEPEAEDYLVEAAISESSSDDDWDAADEDFFDLEEGDGLPEWINQLGDSSATTDSSPPPLSSDEELPDWIASMRPEDDAVPSDLGGSFSAIEPEISDSLEGLEGLPFDLAGGDLPDWLTQDDASANIAEVAPELGGSSPDRNPEIPDWLKADSDEGAGGEGDDNWVSMLDKLPGVVPPASTLARADIPAWVQELKPAELDDDATSKKPRVPEGPEEKEGPLAGLRGVVAIETATIQPHSVEPVQQYMVTPEQKDQIALLQQILHEERGSGSIIVAKKDAHVSAALRIVLSILLIGAIVLGLRTISLAKTSFSTVPAPVLDMNTAVINAANTPVLVAFEYTPAMSGELSPQAETLLQQLADQNSEIITISQYPAATGIVDALGDQYQADSLGYLPGNAIGLRQLSDCLTGQSACETLVGKSIPSETKQKLRNVELIIVLTGNKESLTNWIEQVGTKGDVVISAGVTTALAPSASPYYATNQLSGYLGGLLDTAVYQDLIDDRTQNVSQLLNAEVLGQILAGTLLLIGLIVYGISGSLSTRGNSKRS